VIRHGSPAGALRYNPRSMSLLPGARLGPYEIIGPLGAGGMGEVYRGRDARLQRDVAIKVILGEGSRDPDRLARFEQEARATAALNHANIVAVFDTGQAADGPFIVSELLEGETLRERIARGRVAPRTALDIGAQIARGLAAAHDKGVLHRDLKPENVFITADGTAKILDFGLAKLRESSVAPADAATAAVPSPARTGAGMVLGTVGYMSPEQVRGEAADHRSDIFALGCVLYEMLAGQRAFGGPTHVETMHAILTADPPDASATGGGSVAPAVERTVRRCLEKQPSQRFQSARDLAFALESLNDARPSGPAPAAAVSPGSRPLRAAIPWAFAAVLAAALIVMAWTGRDRAAPPPLKMHFEVQTPEASSANQIAMSPSGAELLAIIDGGGLETRRLWMRRMAGSAVTLPGTEDAQWPFWSPDGRSIGFFAHGKLKRLDVQSGALQTLADVPLGFGGSWNGGGVILFTGAEGGVVHRIAATGGAATPLTTLDESNGELAHRQPFFLPDGQHFLYIAVSSKPGRTGVYLATLDAPRGTLIAETLGRAAFVPPHWLLLVKGNALLAQRFDVGTRTLSGEPITLDDDVSVFALNSAAGFTTSSGGLVAFRRMPPSTETILRWFDRGGRAGTTVSVPASYSAPALSPDERSIAVHKRVPGGTPAGDIWIIDVQRGTHTRFTFSDTVTDREPIWSPDGQWVVYGRISDKGDAIYRRHAAGLTAEEPVVETVSGSNAAATGWSHGGAQLLYRTFSSEKNWDLWTTPIAKPAVPVRIISSPFSERWSRISPDGRLLAYTSNESGEDRLYLVAYPDPRNRIQVSSGLGRNPRWRGDSRELYFDDSRQLFAAAVAMSPDGVASAGVPGTLFELPPGGNVDWDVTQDGQRFLLNVPSPGAGGSRTGPLHVLVNWIPQ
jgi:Tol biopolymer transport system component